MKHESTNEPVAWMASDDPSAIESSPPHPELIHQWIPLYTHPPVPTAQPKPLTDEKISLIAHNTDTCDWNDLNFKECWHKGFKAGFREAEIEHNIKG